MIAASAPPPPEAAAAPKLLPKRLLLIGDSIGAFTIPALLREMPDWQLRSDTHVARNARQGAAVLTRKRRRGRLAPVITVSLGTNDDPRTTERFRLAVESIAETAGFRCVIWPNIYRPAVNGVGWAPFNRILEEAAARHRNLRVVDWHSMVAHHKSWLLPDEAHVDKAGSAARAAKIAEEARDCRKRSRGVRGSSERR